MSEERFKNRKEALTWLQKKGQISTGKFYGDCERGYADINGRRFTLTIHPDKSISKFQVAEYAEALFVTHAPPVSTVDYSEKRARLEMEKLEQEVEKGKLANRKEDEKWLYKEDAWAQMAAIIGRLRDSLRHQFHVGTVAIIASAGGDPARGPEVYESAEALISRAFNEIVEAGRIDGTFEKAGENEI